MPLPIHIRFDGPPGPESGRFIEVEQGTQSVNLGEWVQDGDDWLLVLPKPYARLVALEASIERLGNYVAHRVTCHIVEGGFECDCGLREILAVAQEEK